MKFLVVLGKLIAVQANKRTRLSLPLPMMRNDRFVFTGVNRRGHR